MPTYLCHGFRWTRASVRIFVVLENIDDASPDWVIRRGSPRALVATFYRIFDFLPPCRILPSQITATTTTTFTAGGDDDDDYDGSGDYPGEGEGTVDVDQDDDVGDARELTDNRTHTSKATVARGQKREPAGAGAEGKGKGTGRPSSAAPPSGSDALSDQAWSPVKLLEEYDPTDLGQACRPHVFVADYAVRVDLSASVGEEKEEEAMATAMTAAGAGGWLEKLRDQLQPEAAVGWYAVVNGDEARGLGGAGEEKDDDDEDEDYDEDEGEGEGEGDDQMGQGDVDDDDNTVVPERHLPPSTSAATPSTTTTTFRGNLTAAAAPGLSPLPAGTGSATPAVRRKKSWQDFISPMSRALVKKGGDAGGSSASGGRPLKKRLFGSGQKGKPTI